MKKIINIFMWGQNQKILVDLIGILLAMLLAGFLGRYAAEAFTRVFHDELMKLLVGIIISTMIGLGTGIVVHWIWGRVLRVISRGHAGYHKAL